MREHVINVQLKITARDEIRRSEILGDLRKQLSEIQEKYPYRSTHGAGWWTNSAAAVTYLNYDNFAEQLEAEAEMPPDARTEVHLHLDPGESR